MENAAKALTIAGGVLIAIIVVSTLWYSFQQWGILPQAKADNEKISQEVEFNKEFESYNKQNLYGTDVITVINKAMANNEKYGIEGDPSDPYYVDVEIQLVTAVQGYTKTYTRDDPNPDPEYPENLLLSAGNYLISNPKHLGILKNLCKSTPVDVKETKKGKDFIRVETYSAEEDFKLRYFTCTKMEPHPSSGRICRIVFEERIVDKDKLNVEVFEVN